MRVWVMVLALWAAGLGAAAQFGKMSVGLSWLADRYPAAGPVELGLVVSVVGLVGLVLGAVAGMLSDWAGPRRVLIGALGLGAGMGGLQVLPVPLEVLLATRVAEGLSHLAIVVVAPTMIAALVPPGRLGPAMTLWSSFFGVTYAILAVVAPPLLDRGGLGALWGAHAAYLAVMAGLLALWLPKGGRRGDWPEGGLIARHRGIYASPRLAAPALGFLPYTALYVAVLTLLPPAVPEAWRALVAAGMPLVSIAVSLSAGVLLLRVMAAVRLVQAGFAVGGLSALAIWLSSGPDAGAALAVCCLIFAGAMGIVQGASFAAIPELNEGAVARSEAAGAVAQLGNLGTTTGTPLLAAVMVGAGMGGFAALALGLCLFGIGVHSLQAWRRQR